MGLERTKSHETDGVFRRLRAESTRLCEGNVRSQRTLPGDWHAFFEQPSGSGLTCRRVSIWRWRRIDSVIVSTVRLRRLQCRSDRFSRLDAGGLFVHIPHCQRLKRVARLGSGGQLRPRSSFGQDQRPSPSRGHFSSQLVERYRTTFVAYSEVVTVDLSVH